MAVARIEKKIHFENVSNLCRLHFPRTLSWHRHLSEIRNFEYLSFIVLELQWIMHTDRWTRAPFFLKKTFRLREIQNEQFRWKFKFENPYIYNTFSLE